MTELSEKTCIPCRGGVQPLTLEENNTLIVQLPGWSLVDNHHIEKTFRFRDFAAALHFVNAVGNIAEEQGHHPEINLAWGKARITVWTHKIDGLTESDFIFAAKVSRVSW